jgi:hypothetical protein
MISFLANIPLQKPIEIREKLCKTLLHKRAAHKMLVKLTPGLLSGQKR